MARSKPIKPVKWYVPLRFNRRQAVRLLREVRLGWLTVTGLMLANLLHEIVEVGIGLELAPEDVAYLYAVAVLGVPVTVLLPFMALLCILPIAVQVSTTQLQHGSGVIAGARLHHWRFRRLLNVHDDCVLRLRYDACGRTRKMSIFISPTVDLVELERALRRAQRLGRMRARKRKSSRLR